MATITETPVKTVGQAEQELRDVRPDLFHRYRITSLRNGVCLMRGGISIICNDMSYGHEDGLYEIRPVRKGKTFKELFGTIDQVRGYLSLQTALEIAEKTLFGSTPEVRDLARQYFI